jgi:nucleotide-binding universal stress UspA family protein
MLPVDFSSSTHLLYEKTLELAKAFHSQVYLVHVVLPNENCDNTSSGEVGSEFADESMSINQLANQFRDQDIETHALLLEGVASRLILDEARRLDADIIVMGSHGHGAILGVLMGDVSQSVLKEATCPVLIVPTR